ncbi:MAG: isopentenyl-diphosphate Delta-isomerase [Gemmatimonadaceae bacterium]|nr:isopentenyl-diphosphate Delta-isomerase [Gemmatimonadaceae bacterium]
MQAPRVIPPGEGVPPVIVVDASDRPLRLAEKLSVHQTGTLHRAVSVFAFDASGAMLVQRRAAGKYHSGGLWSNSACTHPRDGESPAMAARRCLREEMGVECVSLEPAFAFIYRAQVAPTLVEHEYDHVFVARVVEEPSPNADEVSAWRRLTLDEARAELAADDSRFSAWFPLALERLAGLEVTARASQPLAPGEQPGS